MRLKAVASTRLAERTAKRPGSAEAARRAASVLDSTTLYWLAITGCLLVSGCSRHTDAWWEQSQTLQSLGAGIDVDAQGAVTFINLSRSPATDRDLECLKHFATVEQLWLYDTRTTDAGLKQLRNLTQLKVLVLGKTDITDRGLNELAHLSQLKELYLYPADVSAAAVARLQDAIPETLIIY